MVQRKACPKCGVVKPLDDFYRDKKRRDGRRPWCKNCVKVYVRKYREENREKVIARERKYREENREKVIASNRKYYEENREKVIARERKYYEENREKLIASNRKYYEENREKVIASNRKYREENREIIKAVKFEKESQLNAATMQLAHRQGKHWEDWEDVLVMADNGQTVYQKAITLHRTYSAVQQRRTLLAKETTNA